MIPSSNNFDLRSEKNVKKILKKNDIVIHLAANVGGLGKGVNKSGNYFFDNSIMGLNLIKFGNEIGIKQFIGVGSILQYPNQICFTKKGNYFQVYLWCYFSLRFW